MADKDPLSRDAASHDHPLDPLDATPPHGDELTGERSFGRTDRYANRDDPDAESPVLEDKILVPDEELNADARRRRMEQMDDAAADDARMATRKREHSAE